VTDYLLTWPTCEKKRLAPRVPTRAISSRGHIAQNRSNTCSLWSPVSNVKNCWHFPSSPARFPSRQCSRLQRSMIQRVRLLHHAKTLSLLAVSSPKTSLAQRVRKPPPYYLRRRLIASQTAMPENNCQASRTCEKSKTVYWALRQQSHAAAVTIGA